MTATTAAILAGWASCGVLAYGMSLAFWQRKFVLIAPSQRFGDVAISICGGILGPIGLLSMIIMGGFSHGLMFRPFTKSEWLLEAEAKYPEFTGILEQDWK